ncbi:hypothetical protein CALVIDRAFT_463508, partial [Calocera viscosa TUFC12733]
MPIRTSRNAPVLESARPEHVVRFLEDVEQLCEGASVPPEKWIYYCLRYVQVDVAQVWEALPETTAAPPDYKAFRKAVLELYPGAADDDRRYSRLDLERIVAKSAAIPMANRAQYGEYHRQFLRVSKWLEDKKKLSQMEKDQMFLRGFHFEFQERLRARLLMVNPDVFPDDPYDMEKIAKAATFLLTGTSATADFTPLATSSESTVSKTEPSRSQVKIESSIPVKAEPDLAVQERMLSLLARIEAKLDNPVSRPDYNANQYRDWNQPQQQQQGYSNNNQRYRENRPPGNPSNTCTYCGALGHYLRECADLEDHDQKGLVVRNGSNRWELPDGTQIPNYPPGPIKVRVLAWHERNP